MKKREGGVRRKKKKGDGRQKRLRLERKKRGNEI